MTIYQSLSDARAAAATMPDLPWLSSIAEIEHVDAGRCYIIIRCPVKVLQAALARKPMPEIRRIVAEHPIVSDADRAARAAQHAEDERCARCGCRVPSTAYHQTERWRRGIKVIAYYCDGCRRVLSAIGQGEYDGLQERAGAPADNTPYTSGETY